MRDVWVGVTVVPHAKTAHVQTFESEEGAKEYLDKADEKAQSKDYEVWTNITKTTIKEQ